MLTPRQRPSIRASVSVDDIDARGQTSVSGVFAVGDATAVLLKRIVIALSDGATASVGACEYLIRSGVATTAGTQPVTSAAA